MDLEDLVQFPSDEERQDREKRRLEEEKRLLTGLEEADLSQCVSRFTRSFQEAISKRDKHESVCIANARSFEIQACTEVIPILLQVARDLKHDAYRAEVAFVLPSNDSGNESRIRIRRLIAEQPMRGKLEIYTWPGTEQTQNFVRMRNAYDSRHDRAIKFTLVPTDQSQFDELGNFGLSLQSSLHPCITMSLQADQAMIHIHGTQFRDERLRLFTIHLHDLKSQFARQVIGSFLNSFTEDNETCKQGQ